MARQVKCPYCEKQLNKDDAYEYKKRYYHTECFETWQREGQDYKDLKDYICELYRIDTPSGMILKQIKDFKEDLNYKYKGMELALRYFYETLGNSVQENSGVGIIPYVYEDAKRHYITKLKVEESIRKSENNIEQKVVTVQSPQFTYNKKIKQIDISSLY
jgi:hypothetical protein